MSKPILIWIDLEMSGLDLKKDVILEIATVLTDVQLHIIAQGPVIAIHQSSSVLDSMDEWCKKQHTKSGLCAEVLNSLFSLEQAETQTTQFIAAHCKKKEGLLAGNSIWQDRAFIQQFMPRITEYFHYKMIDVTSVQQLIKQWYPKNSNVEFKKKDNHRALPDIYESIAELQHYRNNFFVSY